MMFVSQPFLVNADSMMFNRQVRAKVMEQFKQEQYNNIFQSQNVFLSQENINFFETEKKIQTLNQIRLKNEQTKNTIVQEKNQTDTRVYNLEATLQLLDEEIEENAQEINRLNIQVQSLNAEIQALQQRLEVLNGGATDVVAEVVSEEQEDGNVEIAEVNAESIFADAQQEIMDAEDIPAGMKESVVDFLSKIKDKDPKTVSWYGVLFKEFDPSLEQAQQYSADYDSESRRVVDVLSKTADGKGIDYNLLNEKERGEFDADRDRFCEYEKIISPTAFKELLEGASSEEEKKQIKEKYEAEEPRRRAISEQSSSNFLSRYKLREKDSKERSINLRNQVRSKEDAITNNPKYQKTIDVVKGVYDKMREKLDGLKKDSNE